ncbi:MAG: alpha/beta hydrolase [Deltaproteobacteria bacterium HGW-Deltaproteobacteria-21]|nr:MAG: alpha/beta hydrolase [Deltaproteobacteria bacterium HGW-Deltaproteobacteria-21]
MGNMARDYSKLDRSEILRLLFHPRPELRNTRSPDAEDVMIGVGSGVALGARFFFTDAEGPNLLFFHGNGEIVADYDDMGRIYRGIGINFFPVDYRGYGRSSGVPTIGAMMRDCHAVFDYFRRMLSERGQKGALLVMGRSLGCASALELASAFPRLIDGLIIESGFARISTLLQLFGLDMHSLGLTEEDFGNLRKISGFKRNTLIIHGEEDELIPVEEGRALYEASGASEKSLLIVQAAGHNDLFMRGFQEYLNAVRMLADKTNASRKSNPGLS